MPSEDTADTLADSVPAVDSTRESFDSETQKPFGISWGVPQKAFTIFTTVDKEQEQKLENWAKQVLLN